MFICKICNKKFNKLKGLSQHIRHSHKMTASDYYINYIDSNSGKCYCGNSTQFISIIKGFQKHCCKQCANKDPEVISKINKVKSSFSDDKKKEIRIKTKNTFDKKYGGIGFASKELSEKSKLKNEELHGDKNFNNRKKCEETNLKKYGYKTNLIVPENIESFKQIKKNKYGDENYNNREKCKKTNLKKYGTICPSNSKIGKEKSIQTMILNSGSVEQSYKDRSIKSRKTKKERYGDENYHNTEQLKKTLSNKDFSKTTEKRKITCLKKYDVDSYSKTNEFLKKYEATNQKRYGYKYPFAQGKFKQNFSKGEKEVVKFIKGIYSGIILEGDRTILKPTKENGWKSAHELDIYLPEIKVAIEYNGNYYHDYNKFPEKKDLDNQKQLECKKLGIKLLIIWENEWKKETEKMKKQLKDFLEIKK